MELYKTSYVNCTMASYPLLLGIPNLIHPTPNLPF